MSKEKLTYLIFGLLTLTLIVTTAYFISYQSKPAFSTTTPQPGIFQDPEQIDTTIKSFPLSKFRYQNNNPLHRTSFKTNPTTTSAINFANQYTNLSFFTNVKQDFGQANTKTKPVTKDSSVTYPNIFPNTDLKYTVENNRLLEEFIIHNKETALKMTKLTQTLDIANIDSYKEIGGTIELYKGSKLVATVPKPVMYEHNDNSKKSYDLSYTVKELDKDTLEVTKLIDEKGIAWLKNPARIYPIVIDLVIDNADTSANWVSSDTTSTVVTQETSIKQEGTGSVKVTTTAETDTTIDLMEYSSDSAAQTAYAKQANSAYTNSATGGTITTSGSYKVHKFTSSGTFTPNHAMDVEVLAIAGGGGGGRSRPGWGGGGGGGAGGMLFVSSSRVSTGGHSVSVGGGGAGNTDSTNGGAGANGGNSVFNSLTATGGGGGGGGGAASGQNGGSGGGGAYAATGAGTGIYNQGHNGGAGEGNVGSFVYDGGSGGGAGGRGTSGASGTGSPIAGGVGLASSFSGSSVTYATGGSTNVALANGAANTGNGGSSTYGGGTNGGNGGSGVVIIRYLTQPETITEASGYLTHVFKSYGTLGIGGSGNVQALVVAGGAGGGRGMGGWGGNGGGGAGGYQYSSSLAVTAQTYGVTVGGGGLGWRTVIYGSGPSGRGDSGQNSVFGSLTATGGGGGGGSLAGTGSTGAAGGSGGGGAYGYTAGGTGSQGGNGGSGVALFTSPYNGGGGGGAGGNGANGGSYGVGVTVPGGAGTANSITGSSITYAVGGAGNGASANGTANRGNGGGSSPYGGGGGGAGNGGSGIVVVKYPVPLISYTESSIKTQGTYSLKGVATTLSLNKTLTHTLSPINLAGHDTINFDIRSTRTGSNIKVGIHDSGGTTTEITPNITSANAFQATSWDISGVSNANKDAIDSIIITIVNSSAANTFYIDDMTATGRSINDTVTLTKSATDLSSHGSIAYWVRSDTTGSFARFEFGESTSSEQTHAFTITSANTWEQKTFDISGISSTSRDAVTKFAFKITSDTGGAILYFDNINTNSPPNTPTLDLPIDTATNQLLLPVLKTTTTDSNSDYLRYKIELCEDVGMTVNCQTFDQTSSQTGWSGQNTETSTAYTSGTQGIYTIQSALADNDTFYWRSYAIDPGGTNTWSATQGTPYSFTTTTAPTAPTALYTEGTTNPANVVDLTPEFSAVHNDSDGDSANYYQIIVDTQVGFDGVEMWDSGKQSMTETANGVRSPDISYAGSALSLDNSTYYWKIKFWDTIGAEGDYSSTANFGMNILPNTPSLDLPTNTNTNQSVLPALKTTATDSDGDYLRYKIELCENVGMSASCQTFDQTSSQTGWSGQDAQSTTAYASGTQGVYTIQSALSVDSTYYWRSYAIDPAGANTWSSTQGTPYLFNTGSTPIRQSDCRISEASDDSQNTILWTDTATNEDGYRVDRSEDAASWSTLSSSIAADSVSYIDSTITANHTYYYRIAPFIDGPIYGDWCYTETLTQNLGSFRID
jgi:hypothetical protein